MDEKKRCDSALGSYEIRLKMKTTGRNGFPALPHALSLWPERKDLSVCQAPKAPKQADAAGILLQKQVERAILCTAKKNRRKSAGKRVSVWANLS